MKNKLIILLLLTFTHTAYSEEIFILHNDTIKPKTTDIKKEYTLTLINVDGLKNGINEINSKLTKNESQSKAIADELIPKQKSKMQEGMRGLGLIKKWDIRKLPAIVFNNGTYVYYGSNVEAAIKLWERRE